MKKTLCVILAVTMLISAFVFTVSAEKSPLKLTVISDIHYNGEITEKTVTGTGMYDNTNASLLMYDEAVALYDSFFSSEEVKNCDYILISGDMVSMGMRYLHEGITKILSDYMDKTGKQILVVPGNHDYSTGMSPDEFTELYARFGYTGALERDDNTASYTYDLNDEYRLLAIDSCAPYIIDDGINADLLSWIEAQVKTAERDGKKLIGMMHHNLINHFTLENVLAGAFVVKDSKSIADKFADWGIKYVFTGHEHSQDIAMNVSVCGNTVYDIVTGSFLTYPIAYRTAEFSADNVKINSHTIKNIDASLLPAGYTDEQLAAIANDFEGYCDGYARQSAETMLFHYLNENLMREKLDANKFSALLSVTDKVMPRIRQALSMPLYPDGTGAQNLSDICGKYGLTLPESSYSSLMDIAAELLISHYLGDENHPMSSAEFRIVISGVSAGINYALSKVTDSEFAAVLSEISALLGADISPAVFMPAGKAITRADRLAYFALRVLSPVLESIATDDAPADNNVELPAYDTATTKDEFFAPLKRFFKWIERFLRFYISIFCPAK